MKPNKIIRQSKRIKDVLGILIRNGFGDMADAIRSKRVRVRVDEQTTGENEQPNRPTRAERIRLVLEELGPTYVKLGQVLSTRPDLVPPDLIAELAKLQDQVEPFSFDDVRKIVEAELGQPLEAVFESFESNSLASASVGQVHMARLNGLDVVVKVQRPGIRETMEADIRIMMQLASQLERHVESWSVNKPTLAVREFFQTITEELDYKIEAAHHEQVVEQFKNDPTIHIPRIFRNVSTSRILTMEYIDGIKVSNLEALRAAHIDFEEVARRGFRFVIQQTLVHGFFHADPHPGNIFVLPDNVVCFIDFGMMGRLSQKVRDDFVELVYNVLNQNPHRVTEAILRLATPVAAVDVPELERDVARLMDEYRSRSLCELDLPKLLGEILGALARHGLRIPSDLFLMLKAITQIEAAAAALVPEFDLVKEAEPYVRSVFLDRFRPQRLVEETANVGREYALLVRDAPEALRELSRVVKGGDINIRLKQESLPEVLSTSDRIANRLSFAFVLGACLVGSSILAAAKIPPAWNGISILGLGGFFVALAMSAWLIISILRRGRL